jgi:hypothetical protein
MKHDVLLSGYKFMKFLTNFNKVFIRKKKKCGKTKSKVDRKRMRENRIKKVMIKNFG